MKETNSKVVKAGLGYTIGNYLLKGLSFFTIPIFARLMTTVDYGLYNTYASYDGILFVIIGLALHSSFKNAKYKFKAEFNKYISSCMLLSICSLVVWLIAGNVLYFFYCDFIDFKRVIINVLIFNSFGNAVIQYYNVYMGINYRYQNFLKIATFNALASLVLSICLIFTIFREKRYLGRILGTAIPVFIITFYIATYFFKKEKPNFDKRYWKYAIKYSLPIIPHGLSQVILSQFDRIMITHMVGAAASGIYSFGYNIYTLIAVTATSVDNVWGPWFYEKMNCGDTNAIKKQGSKYAFGMLLFSVSVMLVAPEIILILGTLEYADATYVVIPIVAGGFFSFLYTLPVQIEYYYEKTKGIAIATTIAALINIVLNWIFINLLGYIAAAYTTLVTYLLYFIFHYFISIKIAKKSIYESKHIILISISIIVSAVIALMLVDYLWIRWFLAGLVVDIFLFWLNKELNLSQKIRAKIKERI